MKRTCRNSLIYSSSNTVAATLFRRLSIADIKSIFIKPDNTKMPSGVFCRHDATSITQGMVVKVKVMPRSPSTTRMKSSSDGRPLFSSFFVSVVRGLPGVCSGSSWQWLAGRASVQLISSSQVGVIPSSLSGVVIGSRSNGEVFALTPPSDPSIVE